MNYTRDYEMQLYYWMLKLHDNSSYSLKTGQTKISILRDDLARIVGTAKESVIRMLTEFKEDGYIDITDGVITVLKEQRLKAMNC